MIDKRRQAIGIKQVIRFRWMEKAHELLHAGHDAEDIRQELHDYLVDWNERRASDRQSTWTRTFAVNNLMKIWVQPDTDLALFRDASSRLLLENPTMSLAIHWSMISAVYPFWFYTAQQVGRLLTLQSQVTQSQIVSRLKQVYGDRMTVSRYARFVIRSFVSWNVLQDTEVKGCYQLAEPTCILDDDVVALMFESALLANTRSRCELGVMRHNPAFFPFQLPATTSESLSDRSDRMSVIRQGLSHVLLELKPQNER